jgi:hypothetical protein
MMDEREMGSNPAETLMMGESVSNIRLPDEEILPHPNYKEVIIPE